MILNIKNVEAATLVLHMSIMRKSFRNLLKKNYKQQKDDYLESYDYVLQEAAYVLENHLEAYQVHLNISDLQVLTEFLNAYTNKAKKELESHLKEQDREQLHVLADLKDRCQELIRDAS